PRRTRLGELGELLITAGHAFPSLSSHTRIYGGRAPRVAVAGGQLSGPVPRTSPCIPASGKPARRDPPGGTVQPDQPSPEPGTAEQEPAGGSPVPERSRH